MATDVQIVSSWVKKLGNDPAAGGAALVESSDAARAARKVYEQQVEQDEHGLPKDPLLRLFYDALSKRRDETREAVLRLVQTGEQRPVKYYSAVREILLKETPLAAALKPTADLAGADNKSFDDMVTAGCAACAACVACVGCVWSVAGLAGAAGATGTWAA